MGWKVKETNLDQEKEILVNMIFNVDFIKNFKSLYKPNLFKLSLSKLIIKWCYSYYHKYNSAPKNKIYDLFKTEANNKLSENQIDEIFIFLENLLKTEPKKDETDVKFLLDKAELYLKERSLQQLAFNISDAVSIGNFTEAEDLIEGFKRIGTPRIFGVDPFSVDIIAKSFDDSDTEDLLFSMPGALGEALGTFERGQLWAVVASMKKGKTWWLQDIAIRGLMAGFNILFVSLEMSVKNMVKRFHHYLTGLPNERGQKGLLIPMFDCQKNASNSCNKDYRSCFCESDNPGYYPCSECKKDLTEFEPFVTYREVNKEVITAYKAIKKAKAVKDNFLRNNRFHLVEFPSKSITMKDLDIFIDSLKDSKGFIPDIIITDYADKVNSSNNLALRDQIYEVWEGHKSLAQKRKCLVITASQSNTARTGKDIGQGDWADDIRKLAMVDGAWALNQTPVEKNMGITRIKILAHRNDDFDLSSQITVLQQLKIGRPYLDSIKGKLEDETVFEE